MASFFVSFLYIAYRVRYSALGYRLLAIRENENAAEALGVDVRRYKLIAVMIYAFLCGLVGSVHCMMYGFTQPYHTFNVALSAEVVMLGNIGGVGTILGPAAGAVTLGLIIEYLRLNFSSLWIGVAPHLLIYGAVMMVIVLLRPGGIIHAYEKYAKAAGRLLGWVKEE